MKRISALILAFVSLGIIGVSTGDNCEVTITNGKIIGLTSKTENPERDVCSYLGIPYAAPPVGDLRFKRPKPAAAFMQETFFATSLPNWCPQIQKPPPEVKMDEDCLQLNVHVPKTGNATDLPVMVFLHGGGFLSGSSDDYNAKKLLARHDVILVVPHYRLGVFGFFSTGDNAASGNFALKDQSFALHWIREHIRQFGGHPLKLTIFGESAGSGSVLLQMVSPLNKGLLSGVIAQSGTILSTNFLAVDPLASATQLAKFLICPTWPTALMVTCIRTVSWQRLIFAQAIGQAKSVLPVKEHWHLDGPLITKEPLDIIKTGKFDKVPLMIGATKHEGSLILAALYAVIIGPLRLDRNPDFMRNRLVPEMLKMFSVEEDVSNRGVSSSIEMAYLSGLNRTNWMEVAPGLVDIATVFTFKSSTLHLANLLSDRDIPVYLYSFEHHSDNTLLWNQFPDPKPPVPHGIAHADDLLYLFDFPGNFTSLDQQFSEIFIDMWADFAKTGNPTPSPDPRFPQWPTYDNNEQLFMKLNVTPTVLVDYTTSWHPKSFFETY